MEENEHRFSLVASFYGPGNMAAWLATIASVFVTWCLNAEYRQKDSFSADLLFALAIPGVSAGHVIYLMFFPGLEEHDTVRQLFSNPSPKIIQHAAAVEAALTVCETFSAFAVALAFISMLHAHWKRTVAVLVVGLFAFSVETIIFFHTRGTAVEDSNLSRPFLFNYYETMIPILMFLAFWIPAFTLVLCWLHGLAAGSHRHEKIHLDSVDDGGVPHNLKNLCNRIASEEVGRIRDTEVSDWAIHPLLFLNLISAFFVPLSFGATIFGASGAWGSTDFMSHIEWTGRLRFFFPRTATKISDLDQAVSICAGLITLAFSVREAHKSHERKEKDFRREMRQEMMEEMLKRQRHGFTQGMRLLMQIQEQLDRTQNEAEEQVLLDRRRRLITGVVNGF